jgi:hypothetical protein
MARPERARDRTAFWRAPALYSLVVSRAPSAAPSGRDALGRVPGVETPGLSPLDPFGVKKHRKFCLSSCHSARDSPEVNPRANPGLCFIGRFGPRITWISYPEPCFSVTGTLSSRPFTRAMTNRVPIRCLTGASIGMTGAAGDRLGVKKRPNHLKRFMKTDSRIGWFATWCA